MPFAHRLLSLAAIAVLAGAGVSAAHANEDASDAAFSINDVLQALLEGSPELQRARFAWREAELSVRGSRGVFDPVVGSELDLNRTAIPTQSGLSSGLSVSERYSLAGSYTQQFAPGTTLSLGLSTAITRSRFPFRSSLGSNALIDLLASGVSFDEALGELERLNAEQTTQTIVDGPNFENALSLTLTQPLLRGFGRQVTTAPRSLAEAQLDLRERELLQQASARALEALTAYSELRYAYEEHALRERSLARTERQLEISEAELAAGQIAPIDLDLVLQQMATNRETLLVAEGEIARRSRDLGRLIGWPADHVDRIRPSAPLERTRAQAFDARDCQLVAALAPEVRVAEQQVEIARRNVPAAEDGTRAQLDARANIATTGLDANYGEAWADVFGFRGTAIGAGLVFSTPLGNRAALSEYERAELAVEQARFEVETVGRQLCYQLRELVESVALLEAREQLAAERIEIAVRAVDAEQERFAQGLSTVQLGLDALERLEEAEIAHLRVHTDAEIARWQMEQLRGELAARIGSLEGGT